MEPVFQVVDLMFPHIRGIGIAVKENKERLSGRTGFHPTCPKPPYVAFFDYPFHCGSQANTGGAGLGKGNAGAPC